MDSILRHRPRADSLLEHLDLAARGLLFVADVGFLESLAVTGRAGRAVGGGEQGPLGVFHHPLHEQVRHPVGGVHVVGAAAVVAGVLAQFQEFLDVHVPGFQEGAHRALALAALVHRDGGVVGHFQEGHHALGLAVGALDVGAQAAHPGPVVAEAAGVLLQQGVFLDGTGRCRPGRPARWSGSSRKAACGGCRR